MYADVGKHLKKPAECYVPVDQHRVTYSTIDMNATKRKAATMPTSSNSSDKGICMTKTYQIQLGLELATVYVQR